MKRLITKFLILTVSLLFLIAPSSAMNLDKILTTVLPFTNQHSDNYYIKAKVSDIDLDTRSYDNHEYKIYQLDNHLIVSMILPLDDGTQHEIQFKFKSNTSFSVKPSLNLFLKNYTLQIVGVDKIAGRDVFIINIINKNTNQKAITYAIDQETSFVLKQLKYDNFGNIYHSFQVTEIEYDPNFSSLDFHESPVLEQGTILEEITEEQMTEYIPWLKLDNLSLPHGFEIIGYAQVQFGSTMLEEVYLKYKNPDIPVTNLYILLSDGLQEITVHVAYQTNNKPPTNYSIEVVETSPETYIMISVPRADTVLSAKTAILTPKEILSLLEEFVP